MNIKKIIVQHVQENPTCIQLQHNINICHNKAHLSFVGIYVSFKIVWIRLIWDMYYYPPPPHSHRIREVPMLIPLHLNLLSREKDMPPISGIGYHWQVPKNTNFPRPSLELFPRQRPQNIPLPRENGNTHAAPLCFRVGRGRGTTPNEVHEKLSKNVLMAVMIISIASESNI